VCTFPDLPTLAKMPCRYVAFDMCAVFLFFQVIVVPILQSFGLLFKGRFDALGISGTDASVIINVNSAFGMILGT
jgi:hypothetical protein